MTAARPRLTVVAVALILVGVPACDRDPEFAEVEGVVTLDSTPVPEAVVAFLPDPYTGTEGPPSSCYSDAAGKFRMRTHKGTFGVALGKCRICVYDPREAMSGSSRIPAKYGSSAQTPFTTVEIKTGPQTINVELSSK